MLKARFTFGDLLISKAFSAMSLTSFSKGTDMGIDNRKKNQVFTEENMISKEPFALFKSWFEEACTTPGVLEPRAMCLATSTRSGIPSARFVILRGFDSDGFKFFTNYCSRKGEELKENPNAALVFYWEYLNKSVRIEGIVEMLPEKDSIEFFNSRPRSAQIEAAFSNQSELISNRNALSEKEKQFKEQYKNCLNIPRPAHWGGFILKPHAIEFWQGQRDRLHDRIRFRIPKSNEVIDNVLVHEGENGWVYERLQP